MKKPVVMLLFSGALIAGYFLLARRADAATTGGGGLLDLFGLGPSAGGSAGGAPGLPFSEVVQPLFPGGGSTPIKLGLPGVAPGAGPNAPATSGKGTTRGSFPVIPSAPATGGTVLGPGPVIAPGSRPASGPAIPPKGRSTPIKLDPNPRPAPKMTPVAVRAAQGVLGVNNQPVSKGSVRRALL